MSRRTKAKMMWTLTVLRNGGQGPVEDLEQAEFRFGRRGEELEEAPLRRLPAGVVSLIQSTNIEQEAMEGQMRTKYMEFMKNHSYESAAFFARQLVCLSQGDHLPILSLISRRQIQKMCDYSPFGLRVQGFVVSLSRVVVINVMLFVVLCTML